MVCIVMSKSTCPSYHIAGLHYPSRESAGCSGTRITPGGAARHFCEPEYMASTCQASANRGTPPREQTVSTSSRVPCFWQSSPKPARFWCVPVLLSPCRTDKAKKPELEDGTAAILPNASVFSCANACQRGTKRVTQACSTK